MKLGNTREISKQRHTHKKNLYKSTHQSFLALREKRPNTELFLVRIFLYSDWIQKNTDQKKLRIWALFTQSSGLLQLCLIFLICLKIFLQTIVVPNKILQVVTEKTAPSFLFFCKYNWKNKFKSLTISCCLVLFLLDVIFQGKTFPSDTAITYKFQTQIIWNAFVKSWYIMSTYFCRRLIILLWAFPFSNSNEITITSRFVKLSLRSRDIKSV